MEFIVRFTQQHDTFRVPELEALAVAENVPIKVLSYDAETPYCIITAPDPESAARLIKRSILTQSIYEYWGSGTTLPELHEAVKSRSSHLWAQYATSTWRFHIDSFMGKRAREKRLEMINSFSYLGFRGDIRMRGPEQEFKVFEEWAFNAMRPDVGHKEPRRYHFGRFLGEGSRFLCDKYDLKKRPYISTTSMDSELALITANIALAGPGKVFYDPFVGTGSFPIACSEFGSICWGSDIDGRAVRGEGGDARAERSRKKVGGKRTLRGNFEKYGLESRLGDVFTSDLTNSPVRKLPFRSAGPRGQKRLFDGIVCDPPYGVREGLQVLGYRDPENKPWADQVRFKDPDFIAPKKPYSFHAMLDDILHFASETLVDDGRLSFWMPTANDENQEIAVPTHPCMETVVVCVQVFARWSRRLITYQKLPDESVDPAVLEAWMVNSKGMLRVGITADELNPFRKGYFTKFKTEEGQAKSEDQ